VIFDIGNVLVGWSPRALYEKVVPDAALLEHLLANVITLDWHTHHDAGLPMAEGVRRLAGRHPEHADLIDLFRTRWHETIGPPDTGVVDILERLARGKRVGLFALTNFSAETYPEFAANHPFMARFDDVLVSGEVGLVKPDPRIYALAIARFRVTPARTLFIDDRDENVAAARGAGMLGHQFKDARTLAAALADLGL